MIGILMVGMVGAISIWGFVQLENRLSSHRSSSSNTASKVPTAPRNNKTVRTQQKNGTPVHVKKIVRSTARANPTAAKLTKITKSVVKKNRPQSSKPNRNMKKDIIRTSKKDIVTNSGIEVEDIEIKSIPAENDTAPAENEAILVADHPDTDTQPAVSNEPGRLLISSQPAAEIYLDGKRKGTTVDNTKDSGWINLDAGRHALELRRRGYKTYRTRFVLDGKQDKVMPRIALESESEQQSKSNALTLRVSQTPAQVTIKNMDNSSTQIFMIRTPQKIIKLDNGRYQVRVERNEEIRERELILTGTQGQLTFTADFKDEE